jgi:hypothetical protein
MTRPMTITAPVNFRLQAKGRRRLESVTPLTVPVRPPGRVPRVARLMALALRFAEQVRRGELANYSKLADLGHVTRARISQIMNLTNLAPDIQEAILFLPRTEQGRDPVHLRLLQPIAAALDWKKQRRLWQALAEKVACT